MKSTTIGDKQVMRHTYYTWAGTEIMHTFKYSKCVISYKKLEILKY